MKLTSKRDLFFLVALIFMVRVAWKMPKNSVQRSITLTNTKPATQTNKPFTVHEADKTVLSQIKTVEKQIEHTISLQSSNHEYATELQNMKDRLIQLKRKYTYTSPAIALLGPIGYAGIVFKEQAIENDVLKISNRCNDILHKMLKIDAPCIPAQTLAAGIQANETVLLMAASDKVETREIGH